MPTSALLTLFAAILSSVALYPSESLAEPRFGDSAWVAPNAYPAGDPSREGPRVAEADREPAWETALRAPFRIAFYPFRLAGEGLERVVDFAEKEGRKRMAKEPSGPPTGIRIAPKIAMSGNQGLGVGAKVTAPLGGPGGHFRGDLVWTFKDNRLLRARGIFGEGVSAVGAGLEAAYDYRPNRRFYGIGNEPGTRRTIFLERETRADAWLFFGRDSTRRARALLGLSGAHIGRGYGGPDHAIDFFDPAEVPFLQRDSRIWSYGIDGQLAGVDRLHEPSRGMHLFGEARRMASADEHDVRFRSWRAEARGYLPVGAERRVLAMRGVYQGVDPEGGSERIPFYRLPVSTHWNRFVGYAGDRFRDRRLLLLQAEYRWLIWSENLWAFGLAQRGEVAGSTSAIRWSGMHEAYGGGLRYRLGEEQTARLDVTRGSEGMSIRLDLDAEF